jgi:hypothetical protein
MVGHIICFSLFGTDPKYRRGMMQNVHALERVYPGWGLLIYCDRINYDAMMQESLGDTVEVVLQHEHSQGMEGMAWRLLAALKPGVQALLFRDSDSLFTTREAEAVNDWLQSRYDTHIIRDHPYHQSPVMGGTLGVKGAALKFLGSLVRDRLHSHRRTEYGDDQVFLSQEFYPKVRANALVHTNCVRYFPERTQPLPADRPGETFVGAYAFLTPDEQAKYEAIRKSEAALTLLPPHWQRHRLLKKIFKYYRPVRRIRHGRRWCV